MTPSPSIERTSPGKPGVTSHVKRLGLMYDLLRQCLRCAVRWWALFGALASAYWGWVFHMLLSGDWLSRAGTEAALASVAGCFACAAPFAAFFAVAQIALGLRAAAGSAIAGGGLTQRSNRPPPEAAELRR